MIATGVASPNAQGQEMTKTEMALFRLNSMEYPMSIHAAKVSAAIAITIGTKTPAILSAILAIGALEPPASSTMRII